VITRLSSQINEPGRFWVNRTAAPAGIPSNCQKFHAFRLEMPQAAGPHLAVT